MSESVDFGPAVGLCAVDVGEAVLPGHLGRGDGALVPPGAASSIISERSQPGVSATAGSGDQERQQMMRRDQVRLDAQPQDAESNIEVVLPGRRVPRRRRPFERFGAPDVIDQHIEVPVFAPDTLRQPRHLPGVEMTDLDRHSEPASSVPWSPAPVTGSRLLDGAVAHLDCDLEQQHLAGDHWIVVGRVRALDFHRTEAEPLVFCRGAFSRQATL
jgi:hypothetical protein